jgi:hypothetical protein
VCVFSADASCPCWPWRQHKQGFLLRHSVPGLHDTKGEGRLGLVLELPIYWLLPVSWVSVPVEELG